VASGASQPSDERLGLMGHRVKLRDGADARFHNPRVRTRQ
jgi:hypothetical protein